MFIKIKNYIKSLYFKFPEEIKWHKRHLQLKHPFMFNRIFQTVKMILAISGCLFIFFAFMYKTKIIVIENNSIMFDINKTFDNIGMSGIITSQISLTMIVVSITSLIASTENKYIFGKKALDFVFPKRLFNTFSLYLIILFLLAFLNIYFLLNKFGDSLIIIDFIFSVLLVAYFVYRFASVFVDQNKIMKKLKYRYYKDNLKHIKKIKPLAHHISKSTEEFKNITIRYIRENNIPAYSKNIDMYFNLIELTLYNNKKLIQNYYADDIIHYDLISHVADFAQELIEAKRIKESLQLYNKIYTKLNYFQIINVSDICMNNMSAKYLETIKQVSSEVEFTEYTTMINHMIYNLNYQIYLYSKTDLSYCRLYNLGMVHMWVNNDLFEKYYLAIYENKHLCETEKSRLFQKLQYDISTMESSNRIYDYNIEDFNKKEITHKEKDVYPIEIKSEPIALMILKMFENKDEENIKLFLNNRLTDDLKNAIKTFVLLSITETIVRNHKKIFRLDLDIDNRFTINVLRSSRIFNMNGSITDFAKLYKLINEKYLLSDSMNSKYCSGSYYGFCPKLAFSKNVVDTYFLFIAELFNQKEEFIQTIGIADIKKDIVVEQQIKEYINQ